jgi:hemoglobin
MKDIETRTDIEILINRFYEKMLKDTIIGFIFTDIAKIDLDEHLTIICDFWETILFTKPVYKRGPEVMKIHHELNKKIHLKKGHFTRWLYLFGSTVDELYSGENAEKAKEKADSIAKLMQKRLGSVSCEDLDVTAN